MRLRNLERFRTGGTEKRPQLSVPLPKTPAGRVYRRSPNQEAHPRHFVLGGAIADFVVTDAARDRMKLEPRSKQTVCPYSGIVDDDQAFLHPDDHKAALEQVGHAFRADVRNGLQRMVGGLNRRPAHSSSFRLKFEVKSKQRPRPRFMRKDLLRELVCDHCGRDYGVFAIGLFCPDCGAPNVRLQFAREVELVGQQVTLAEAQSEAAQELAYRLLGNAHEDVLTAFEATLKAVYHHGVSQRGPEKPPVKPVKNDFQNIERARARFAELGFDAFNGLDTEALATLGLNIQKRHVIGHNLGIADAKFAEHAGDARIGETIQIVGEDIRLFAALGQKVIDRLDAWLGGSPSPTIGAVPLVQMPQSPAQTPVATQDEPVNPDLGLSPLAQRLDRWLAEQSKDGLPSPVDGEAVLAASAGVELSDLEEAIAELDRDGYVTATRSLGPKIPRLRSTPDLYATFDPVVIGSDGRVPGGGVAGGWSPRSPA